MGRNFDDYPGFQPFRSWENTYAQDCTQFSSYTDFAGPKKHSNLGLTEYKVLVEIL